MFHTTKPSQRRSSSRRSSSSRPRSLSQPRSLARRPGLESQPSQQPPSRSVTETNAIKILVDVKDYSELQVNIKDNCVVIDATIMENNEHMEIKKHLSYHCAIKDKFEPSDVTAHLSPDRMLSVVIPKPVSGRVHQVTITQAT